jgi:Protein of unknown function (DUF2452)
MVQLYNFLGSWQLFPEKGQYEQGSRPKNGLYKIDSREEKKLLSISHSWTTIENVGFSSQYDVIADGDIQPFTGGQFADSIQAALVDSITFELHFYLSGQSVLHVVHEIMPNGYLKVTQQWNLAETPAYTNAEFYHKQMSVLPYSASVSGALIRPTEEGVIRHKALAAMEEQTNMQLDQIRRQIELLALQAQEIHKRKELSMLIYQAKLNFKPEIGQVYHLYEKTDEQYTISMISPKEWGASLPYKRYIAAVQLLADHTWKEL